MKIEPVLQVADKHPVGRQPISLKEIKLLDTRTRWTGTELPADGTVTAYAVYNFTPMTSFAGGKVIRVYSFGSQMLKH